MNLQLQKIFFAYLLMNIGMVAGFAAQVTINVQNGSFSPANVTINEGDQIVFQLVSGAATNHPVVSDNGHFTTITWTSSPQTATPITFSTAGTYGYHCSTHGSAGSGMHGTITVNSPTSIKDAKEQYSFHASPNPFEDEVTLTINEGSKKLTAIKVFDIIGKEVANIDLRNRSGVVSYRLDFSKLNAGVYFCNVYSESGIVETRKLFRTK